MMICMTFTRTEKISLSVSLVSLLPHMNETLQVISFSCTRKNIVSSLGNKVFKELVCNIGEENSVRLITGR